MRQGRGRLCLLAQPPAHALVFEQVRWQRLESDLPVQARVFGEIDDPHAAAADETHDAIGADLRALSEGRRRLHERLAAFVRLQQGAHFVLHILRLTRIANHLLAGIGRRRQHPVEDRADPLPALRRHFGGMNAHR